MTLRISTVISLISLEQFASCLLALGESLEVVRAADFGNNKGNSMSKDGIRMIKDLSYEVAQDNSHRLSLYLLEQTTATKLPLIVLIYGGGWSASDKNDFNAVAEQVVQRGYAAASINYRLSQQPVFPAQIIDCKAVIQSTQKQSGSTSLAVTALILLQYLGHRCKGLIRGGRCVNGWRTHGLSARPQC